VAARYNAGKITGDLWGFSSGSFKAPVLIDLRTNLQVDPPQGYDYGQSENELKNIVTSCHRCKNKHNFQMDDRTERSKNS
jgi:hypothetical protein